MKSLQASLFLFGIVSGSILVLIIWGLNKGPTKQSSRPEERVEPPSPNHGNFKTENRSSIGTNHSIDLLTLPIDKETEDNETDPTTGNGTRRKARSPSKVNRNKILAIDCDSGKISREHRFDDCINSKRKCHPVELMILKDLIETGTSIDIVYTQKNDPGKLTMDRESKIYRAHCTMVNVSVLHDGNCYAEGLLPIILNGKKRYLGRANFIIENAIEIPCQRKSTEVEVRQQIKDHLAMAYCVENIVLSVVNKINTKLDVSHLFNPKSMESFLMIQESFTYGCSKDSLLVTFVKFYKKFSPFIILLYTSSYQIFSVVLFCVACVKKLPLMTSLGFLFRCFKTHRDLKKYIKQRKEKDELKEKEKRRKSMLIESGTSDSVFHAHHLGHLYDSVVDLNYRLIQLERLHRPTEQTSEWSLARSENQN